MAASEPGREANTLGTDNLTGVSVGLRAVATIVDGILLGAIGYAIARWTGSTTADGFQLNGGPFFAWAVIALAYYIVLEAWLGATVGKLATGLRVIMRGNGAPITFQAATVRNVMRVVDGLFFYLVGAIAVWSSPHRQRFGDRLAGTIVTRAREAA
jgi:uncharacterized RDD family membrane protein YckC